MNLRDFQRRVLTIWDMSVLGKSHSEAAQAMAAVAKLAEECGEVAQVALAADGWRWGATPDADAARERMAAELGDVLFVVARLACIYGIDLDDAANGACARFVDRAAAQ